MSKRKTAEDQEPFDMDIFMRVCGWAVFEYKQDYETEPPLWWNAECMTFGRAGDQFFYDDIDDWESMDAFFEKYPEASITNVWYHAQPNLDHLAKDGKDVNLGPRKGYINVHTRLTAPWPTSFDDAWDLMIRWDCADEQERHELRRDYEQTCRSAYLRAKLGLKPASQ